jgi:hypothetical protein
MVRKLVLILTIAALSAAAAQTYKVTLFQPTVVQGTELKAGQYKLDLKDTTLVIADGKTSVEAKVSVEKCDEKFSTTTIRFATTGGKYAIQEIRLGGTRTKLVLNP